MPQDPRFYDAVRYFNSGRFFEAHESWEVVWKEAEGADKLRLQGLIQIAVALHHAGRGNMKGARYLLARSRKRLAGVRVFLGVNIPPLLSGLAACVENGAQPPRIGAARKPKPD